MEQPPILGRPTPAPPSTPPAQPGPELARPEDNRSVRGMALATAGVAIAVLALCNGLLLWLYQHSSLAVVVTLGTFVAGAALTWLRNRGRQLTAIVLYVQALMVVSILVGILIGLRAGVATGVLAGGITLAGLLLLSLVGLLYYTGEHKPVAKAVSLGTAVAVVVAMVLAYTFLSWGHQATGRNRTAEVTPEQSVYFLVNDGQYFTGDSTQNGSRVQEAFERYACPEKHLDIIGFFSKIANPGERHLSSTNETLVSQDTSGQEQTATVTAAITVVDDFNATPIRKPETWTFHLEKGPGDQYWRVCSIDRPT
jgi:hypothetical protein